MKKVKALLLTAAIATTSLVAPAASVAKGWRIPNAEGRLFHFNISPNQDNYRWIVVHSRNARWVGRDKLRVEFTIRTADDGPADRTFNPEVLYDEHGRCDNGEVCSPPLMPVVNYNQPLAERYRSEGTWYSHSFTVDCKNAPYLSWRGPTPRSFRLNIVCDHFRETLN